MKARRHHLILRLVDDHVVTSQEQLQGLLEQEGVAVNQATLSRDLRALGVVKGPVRGGGTGYRPATRLPERGVARANLRAFMREIVASGNLLVVRTRVGGAQPVGLALDQLRPDGVIGTIAGDDTVLVVVEQGRRADEVIDGLWSMLEEESGGSS